MRPVIRRWDPNDLETARKVVSRAERRALDRAEEYSRRAESLLHAVADEAEPTGDTEAKPTGDTEAEPTEQTEAATIGGTEAEPTRDAPASPSGLPDPDPAAGTDEAVRLLLEAARRAERVLDAALAAAEDAEAARSQAEVEAARLLAEARAEAAAIVGAARGAMDTERAVHDQLASEMVALRAAVERTKESFELFLTSPPVGPDDDAAHE